MRLRILVIRMLLGMLFACLLAYFFLPGTGLAGILIMAALLVFFAYAFESVRGTGKH